MISKKFRKMVTQLFEYVAVIAGSIPDETAQSTIFLKNYQLNF